MGPWVLRVFLRVLLISNLFSSINNININIMMLRRQSVRRTSNCSCPHLELTCTPGPLVGIINLFSIREECFPSLGIGYWFPN